MHFKQFFLLIYKNYLETKCQLLFFTCITRNEAILFDFVSSISKNNNSHFGKNVTISTFSEKNVLIAKISELRNVSQRPLLL